MAETVTDLEREVVGDKERVKGRVVGMAEREVVRDTERVKDTLLVRVTEVVGDLVLNSDAGTVMRGLGERVKGRVVGIAEREVVRDTERVKDTLLVRVTEVVGDLVLNSDAGTVMRGLGEVLTLRVLVGACEAGTVKILLGERVKGRVVGIAEREVVRDTDRVKDTLLVRVTEVVGDLVLNSEAGTVMRGLGDRVNDTLLLRVTEVVGDLVLNRDAGTVMRGLGEVLTLRVLVGACEAGTVKMLLGERVKGRVVATAEREVVRDTERVKDTLLLRVTEVVGDRVLNREAGTVMRWLGERVKVTLLLRVSEVVGDLVLNSDAGTVMRGLGEVLTLRERVKALVVGIAVREIVGDTERVKGLVVGMGDTERVKGRVVGRAVRVILTDTERVKACVVGIAVRDTLLKLLGERVETCVVGMAVRDTLLKLLGERVRVTE